VKGRFQSSSNCSLLRWNNLESHLLWPSRADIYEVERGTRLPRALNYRNGSKPDIPLPLMIHIIPVWGRPKPVPGMKVKRNYVVFSLVFKSSPKTYQLKALVELYGAT